MWWPNGPSLFITSQQSQTNPTKECIIPPPFYTLFMPFLHRLYVRPLSPLPLCPLPSFICCYPSPICASCYVSVCLYQYPSCPPLIYGFILLSTVSLPYDYPPSTYLFSYYLLLFCLCADLLYTTYITIFVSSAKR
jgi:hypothetical protein